MTSLLRSGHVDSTDKNTFAEQLPHIQQALGAEAVVQGGQASAGVLPGLGL